MIRPGPRSSYAHSLLGRSVDQRDIGCLLWRAAYREPVDWTTATPENSRRLSRLPGQ